MKHLLLALCAGFVLAAQGATTIDPANRFAYGANIGWLNWGGDVANGAVIGEYVCSGYIWGANVGWINLGSGAPASGIYYGNLAAGDFGVNQDGFGNLRGYAWGANIGWINFENTGAPKVDLTTGKISGYIYSANCGWISLSNAMAFVQTDLVAPGRDLDLNGLPDAWELANFGFTGVDPNADPDHDGMSNRQEYLAGTDPNDANSAFKITAFIAPPGGAPADVSWQSVLTRYYYLEGALDLGPAGAWVDSGLGLIAPDGASTTRMTVDPSVPMRFYRVRAVRPLMP